jgi:membrane protease YdiL (CAAX protease family)
MVEDRESRTQRVIAFVALFLMGVSAALAPHSVLWIRGAAPAAAVIVAVYGSFRPGPGAAVAILGAAIGVIAATGIPWQATMPIALGAFFFVSRARPGMGSPKEPVGRVPIWGTVGCAAVTPIALVAWFVVFRPDVSALTEGIPDVGPAMLALGALGFVLITAFCEELIWRGIIQTRLTTLLSAREAIFLQALSFGAAHAHGFPRGAVGVALVSIWGIGLGMLRSRAGGLLAPMLAHVVADTTIAGIVLFLAR